MGELEREIESMESEIRVLKNSLMVIEMRNAAMTRTINNLAEMIGRKEKVVLELRKELGRGSEPA